MRYDLVVIGSGPAGQRAAIQAAKLGKRVAVIERTRVVGGVCVNSGTIPSKTLREAVVHFAGLRERAYYGQAYHPKETVTATDLLHRCNMIIAREIDVVRAQLGRNHVELIQGEGRFSGPHTIEVETDGEVRRLDTDFVILATGSSPWVPSKIPVDGKNIITSDDILGVDRLPRTLLVIGAGVIGVEYASIFANIGVEVTLVDRRETILDFLDRAIVDSFIYQLRDNNVTLRLGEAVEEMHVEGEHKVVCTLVSGKTLVADMAMVSAGRVGATGSLNLEAAGLAADERGRLQVDARFRTAAPHIYAVGDLIGFPALASTAMEQGRLAACDAFGVPAQSLPELFPYGIYSIPEISMVGRTEAELTAEGVPYDEGLARYREIARGQILGDDTGLLKILFHQETRKILGVHAIGTQATELIHIGQAVLAFGGTLDYFVHAVFNYPTLAECYKVAALDGLNKVLAARAVSAQATGADEVARSAPPHPAG